MLNTPIHSLSFIQLTEIFEAENIVCNIRPAKYGNIVTKSNNVQNPRWLILLHEHPARIIAYTNVSIGFQFPLGLNSDSTASPIRKLKLRKIYPRHRVRTFRSNIFGLIVEARIPHTEPVITLIESLHASKLIWEEFNKDD